MPTPDEIRHRLENEPYGEGTGIEVAICNIKIEQAVQLARIADALEAIEKTGVYVYQQGTEDQDEAKEAKPRRQG